MHSEKYERSVYAWSMRRHAGLLAIPGLCSRSQLISATGPSRAYGTRLSIHLRTTLHVPYFSPAYLQARDQASELGERATGFSAAVTGATQLVARTSAGFESDCLLNGQLESEDTLQHCLSRDGIIDFFCGV